MPSPTPYINEGFIKQIFRPGEFSSIGVILNVLFPLITILGALGFLVMMLYGALTWITSGGSKENIAKAQKIFIFSVVGLFIIVTAFLFVKILTGILHVDTMGIFK